MSSIIELSDIEEYNAEDFMDSVKIVNKDKVNNVQDGKNFLLFLINKTKQDKDDTNEDKSEDEENDGTFAFFTSKLQVSKVIYTTVPVKYPDTFPEGIATVYNVTGWKNHMDAFLDVSIC